MQQPERDTGREHWPLERLLVAAGQATGRLRRRVAAGHGLSPTALDVLGLLAVADALSHRELAGRLGLTPATLTPVLDGLERAGALRRERDLRDRRSVRLSITTAGRERSAAARVAAGHALRARLPRPGPDQLGVVRDYLLAVLAAEDGWTDEGPGTR